MEPKPIRGVGLRWALLDALGLYTLETFQKSREEVIIRQRREIAELSTPVVKLWEGILALPLIGTPDSQRIQVIIEIVHEAEQGDAALALQEAVNTQLLIIDFAMPCNNVAEVVKRRARFSPCDLSIS